MYLVWIKWWGICICRNQRPFSFNGLYDGYEDGVGDVKNKFRHTDYCPGCKNKIIELTKEQEKNMKKKKKLRSNVFNVANNLIHLHYMDVDSILSN